MRLILQVASLLLFIICAVWWVVSPSFDALTALIGGVITILTSFIVENKKDKENTANSKRRMMLTHVENFWVKGILEKSLYGTALLDLGIKEAPDKLQLHYPWAIKRDATKDVIPTGTSMLEIFEQIGLGRSLLILGAPGAGKTTMLLKLARQLIRRARDDENESIPVVFNLSSWSGTTLDGWLLTELAGFYSLDKKTAVDWIKENKMLLLLDGLDEVKPEARDQCADAINQFKRTNGLTSMVVCSRREEYSKLEGKLTFEGAVEIQPLTPTQVEEYFKRFSGLAGISEILKKDTTLREMAETPLFLSIMMLAYRDTDSAHIMVSQDMGEQRRHLFNAYVDRMFTRPERSKNMAFSRQDILRWLPQLAYKMTELRQTLFVIEGLRSNWLARKRDLLLYSLIGRLLGGLLFGLSLALIIGLHRGLIKGPRAGLEIGLSAMLVGLLFTIFLWARDPTYLVETLTVTRRTMFNGLVVGLTVGVLGGAIGGITLLASGIAFGLLWTAFQGMEPENVKEVIHPGKRLLLSARNILLLTLLAGLVLGLGIGQEAGLGMGLTTGFTIALLFGFAFGGFFLLNHFALRFVLGINNTLPWKLVSFLDYCVSLIFLRQIGGGYIFAHRLLMEHFAAMYKEDATP